MSTKFDPELSELWRAAGVESSRIPDRDPQEQPLSAARRAQFLRMVGQRPSDPVNTHRWWLPHARLVPVMSVCLLVAVGLISLRQTPTSPDKSALLPPSEQLSAEYEVLADFLTTEEGLGRMIEEEI